LKEVAENGFETKTEINPIAKAATLAERYGNGKEAIVTLKIPLTEDSIGFFDVDEVLGNSELNSNKRSFLESLYDKFRVNLYNMFVKLGYSNKLQYSTFFDFPKIDPEYIVSAKVKKVFFTTEDCRAEEENCNDRSSFASNFNFLNTFFINVSGVEQQDTPEGIVDIGSSEFKKIEEQSFNQNLVQAKVLMDDGPVARVSKNIKNGEDLGDNTIGINLVKFKNNVPYMNLDASQVKENDIYLNFNISDKKLRGDAKKYFRTKRFKHLIKRVKVEEGSLNIQMRKNVGTSKLFKKISADQSFTAHNMFIFRLGGKYTEAKQYFEQEQFSNLIKGTTMIGRSLFVELKNEKNQKEFLANLELDRNNIKEKLNVYKLERCLKSNCLDLEVKDINLVPLLSKSNKIKIDTFLSVRALGSSDFKYSGYLEVEVKWLPPL
jgi:hypothetical protein